MYFRDEIILAGGKPKNHQQDNYNRIKEMEKINKEKRIVSYFCKIQFSSFHNS
jgi:hypothetical protein